MHTATLPDTIYLPDRAGLAINCLLGCLNPDKHQLPFCLTYLTSSPPRMAHTQFDYSDHTARVIEHFSNWHEADHIGRHGRRQLSYGNRTNLAVSSAAEKS